jgi:hypothetical protein
MSDVLKEEQETLKNECEQEEIKPNEIIYNDYSLEELNSIRDSIEQMSKGNQVEVLKILNNKNCIINENKYGIHINLSGLDHSIIEEIKKFINYVTVQENTLNQVEKIKENYKNKYFTKDNKEISCNNTKKEKNVQKSKLQY